MNDKESCEICGGPFVPGHERDKYLHLTRPYKSDTFRICSQECQDKFDKMTRPERTLLKYGAPEPPSEP